MRRLTIAAPCAAAWEQMEGTDRARRCAACDKEVHDLSARTEIEAAGLLLVLGARGLCVRFEHDGEGAVRFAPEPAAPQAWPRAVAGLVAAASMGVAACGPVVPPPAVAWGTPPPSAGLAEPDGARTAPEAGVAADVGAMAAPKDAAVPGAVAAAPVLVAAGTAAPVDTDHDGVADPDDVCPTEPGVRSADPAKNGCPPRVVVVSQGVVVIMERVQFAYGARAVDARGRRIIEEAAKVLKQHPNIEKVAVDGHASSDEPDAVKLGQTRAEVVVAALVALGVEPARFVARSFGSDRPVENNATKRGRERNRRIEFEVLSTTSCPLPGAALQVPASPSVLRR